MVKLYENEAIRRLGALRSCAFASVNNPIIHFHGTECGPTYFGGFFSCLMRRTVQVSVSGSHR
jgi:hypothetical protein